MFGSFFLFGLLLGSSYGCNGSKHVIVDGLLQNFRVIFAFLPIFRCASSLDFKLSVSESVRFRFRFLVNRVKQAIHVIQVMQVIQR